MASKSKETVSQEKAIRQVFYNVMKRDFDIDVPRDAVRIKEEDIFLKTGLTDLDLIIIVDNTADELSEVHGKEIGLEDHEIFSEIRSDQVFFDVINFVVARYHEQIYSEA